jgi:pimeloyl-ACP methyl ester carboxylesterase
MYRVFLTREVRPIATGLYSASTLEVPTILLVGERDLVTSGTSPGKVAGQPELQVEVAPGVGHWVPEQRPLLVTDWAAQD